MGLVSGCTEWDWGIQRYVLIMEKIRKLWDEMNEHPFWIASGIYVGYATSQWLGYFKGYILLERVLLFTLGPPSGSSLTIFSMSLHGLHSIVIAVF
jgi:hypothetical protein